MGFDNECIINIQSLLGEYFCPVCRQLVYPSEALQTQCTHLYCKPCLSYVANSTKACPYDGYLVTESDSKPLVESNKALADTVGKILVHCLYQRSGCTWQGPLSESTSHSTGCTFGNSPVVCNRCAVQIVHRQVQEHAQSCSGVQSQQQKQDSVQDTGTGAASDQSQGGVQPAATTSQTSAATQAVSDPNQPASATTQAQAVNAAVPTQDQWYQQQQYQQYYQQYPGYDPYQQQYQHYYPYQQQAAQQYQQQPGQLQPQACGPSQTQPQPQTQQLQSQAQPQSQQQAQHASAVHPQSHQQAASNSQPLSAYTMQPPSQYQAQSQVPSQGPQYPPTQSYAPPQAAHPVVQQHSQMPQYQQMNAQMQHSTPHAHPQPYPAHPQQYPHVQSQQQLQGSSQPCSQPPTLPTSQPSQPVNPGAPMQVQNSAAHAVTGYQSYQQTQVAPHSMPMTGPHHHGASMQAQFPQQPTNMRPPQPHAIMPNQHKVAALPMQVQPLSAPAQQVPVYPHPQQSGYPVQHRPGMFPGHHATPQQYGQQPSFPGQGPFLQQQTQLRAPGPPQAAQQHYAQPNVAPANMAQNYMGRPLMSQSAGAQAYAQAPGGAGHIRAMQSGGNKLPVNQSYLLRSTSQLPPSSEQQGIHVQQSSKPADGDSKQDQDSRLGMKSVDTNEQKPLGESNTELTGAELATQKQMTGAESESHSLENGASTDETKLKVMEQAAEDRAEVFPSNKSVELASEDQKDKQPKGSLNVQGSQGASAGPASALGQSQFASHVTTDHGRNLMPPRAYAPSLQQRPTMPPGGPQHQPGQLRPHVPGQFPLSGQNFGLDPSGSIIGPGSTSSFGRGPGNLGPVPASYAQQRNPQVEAFGVPPFASQATGTFDPRGGAMARAPMHPLDGSMAHQRLPNSMDAGPGYFDSRQPDSHLHGPNAVKMNGPPGHDQSLRVVPRDDRSNLPPEERMKAYPAVPMQPPINRSEFEEDLKKFPRPSHLDSGPRSRFGGRFPSSGALEQGPHAHGMDGFPRSFENAPHGFDHGMTSSGAFPSRFLPPFSGKGDRHRPGGFHDDAMGRSESGFGLASGSPGREYAAPPGRYGGYHVDIDGNEFGEGSMDPFGKPVRGGRFPPPPSQFRRGELDLHMSDSLAGAVRNNSRIGDAQDLLPRRGEYLGPHGMPMGEPAAIGHFLPQGPASDSFGGNRTAHPRLGEPGFRSRYVLDGGFFPGERDLFDSSRKRKLGGIMCRICKIDCETLEGLDLHSQTREHQKRAMDLVLTIKQKNKKQKNSGDRLSLEGRGKSRGGGFEGRAKKR